MTVDILLSLTLIFLYLLFFGYILCTKKGLEDFYFEFKPIRDKVYNSLRNRNSRK